MNPDTGLLDFAISDDLAAQIRATAEEEHRPATDLVREALERYLVGRFQQAQDDSVQEARALGFHDDDGPVTPGYRTAVREKIAQGMQSLREGKGTDGEAFFAHVEAELAALERQGHK